MKSTLYFFTILALCCFSSLESMEKFKSILPKQNSDDTETAPISDVENRKMRTILYRKIAPSIVLAKGVDVRGVNNLTEKINRCNGLKSKKNNYKCKARF